MQGTTGAAGIDGSDGAAGINGIDGSPGTAGTAGSDGAPGIDGIDGSDGSPGTAGSDGIDGTDGAQGPPGPARVAEYAYVYNLTARSVAIETDVIFDSNGVMTSGITHGGGTAGIALLTAGDYKVTFSVSGTEPNQMAIFVDGTVVDGTVYGAGAGTDQNTGQAIVRVAAGAVLTVRNHSTSGGAVTLATVIGGIQANANASVLIEKLN